MASMPTATRPLSESVALLAATNDTCYRHEGSSCTDGNHAACTGQASCVTAGTVTACECCKAGHPRRD